MRKLTENCKTIAITCRQWGDTGKGKFVDLFADWADIIARGVGGDNAGHTICAGEKTLIMHLIPSGIFNDSKGKHNVIGSGVAFNPRSFLKEIETLDLAHLSHNRLSVAYNAKLILPTHGLLDKLREAVANGGKIGSTGKGIGPVYADHADRQGLTVNDLLNRDFFQKKIIRHLEYKTRILRAFDSELINQIAAKDFELNRFLKNGKFDAEAITEAYMEYGRLIGRYVADTDDLLRTAVGNLNILLEGAQGDLLSVDYGTYPYVTSSDCTAGGLARGVGLNESQIDLSLGIIKGFYMTRVGCGPFPTERGGKKSDEWCNGGHANKAKEDMLYAGASVGDEDEFIAGIALRQAGGEYGATTGRLRRVGWLDLPLLRYVRKFNSEDIILTKLDVLSTCEEIKICHHYIYHGPDFAYAGEKIHDGDKIREGDELYEAIPDALVLEACEPVYEVFPGWKEDIRGCRNFDSLPQNLKKILEYVVCETDIRPRILSVGPRPEETIFI
ncbi:MAG: adenylosuccinate synthetase [Bacillota bacterium]